MGPNIKNYSNSKYFIHLTSPYIFYGIQGRYIGGTCNNLVDGDTIDLNICLNLLILWMDSQ